MLSSCVEDARLQAYRVAENQPIECHVRFVDQDGKPASSVAVKASIWSNDPGREQVFSKDLEHRLTDPDGEIHIMGESGGFLRLEIEDDRYSHGDNRPGGFPGVVIRFTKNSSMGSAEHGTPEVPATYPVWRKEGPQPTISLSGELALEYTGDPIEIDVVAGAVVKSGGDIVIEPSMPKTEEGRREAADHRGIFPASFTVRAVAGGFQPAGEDVRGIGFEYAAGIYDKEFPVKELTGKIVRFTGFGSFRNERVFGKMEFGVGAEPIRGGKGGRVIVRINGATFNATGSRSLESDPSRVKIVRLIDGR
jgi:hypothetical protein